MPRNIIDDVYNKIPDKHLKEIIDNSIKLSTCGIKKCQIEMMHLNKIKHEKNIKIDNLYNKFQEGKITKEDYEKQVIKLNNDFKKSEENFKFIECSLNNCFEFMKKQLLLTINNKLTIQFKHDKEKLNRLKFYNKLFNGKQINMKDIRLFYNEFVI
jgi:hypothetical protein